MERKPKEDGFIEPMPRGEFLKLMKEFKEQGGKYIADENSEAFLEAQGAEAITLDANTILFRKRPTRSAVYEELFHVQQFREGKIDGSALNAYEREVDAQNYLLDNAERFGLTNSEILQTQSALEWYLKRIDEIKEKGDDEI